MRKPHIICIIATFLVAILLCGSRKVEAGGVTIENDIGGSMEFGQIVKGQSKFLQGYMENQRLLRFFGTYTATATLSDRTRASVGAEIKMFNEFPRLMNFGATKRLYYYPSLTQAYIQHSLGNADYSYLQISFGYFPFKYDEYARNLGEYLFRTGTYPQYVKTDFGFSYARLAGLHLSGKQFGNLKEDLIVYMNTEWICVGDINLAALVSYTAANFLDIGCGVSFNSLISADENTTTPKTAQNAYVNGEETSYYTFRGSKVMARVALDFKKIIPSPIWGAADLKLYGEATILGLEDYPVGGENNLVRYDRILRRMPVMVGFNIPTFHLFDTCAIEGEWFGTIYPNDMERAIKQGEPIPFTSGSTREELVKNYQDNKVKWSIYATRQFAKHYSVTLLAASDHMRAFAVDWERQDFQEILRKPDQWYWTIKFGFSF
jgi:hypothetical protein